MKDVFSYKDNELFAEQVALTDIANQFGTPCYVYSCTKIENNWLEFDEALNEIPHRICYAVKANSNLSILQLLAKLNSGFDIVSQGELERVLRAGGDSQKVVFSGVGKPAEEIKRALDVGIYCFNVESESELERINQVAKQQNKIAPVALRINPNIDARTHPYIATGLNQNKFGIELALVLPLCRQIKNMSNLNLIGIGCHIGSQITEIEPFQEALDCLLELIEQLSAENISLKHVDIGGGLGIRYRDENPPSIHDYVFALRNKLKERKFDIILEPGRVIVADAGILLTRVEYLKHSNHKNFAIVDAGMNDLVRPSLYNAWQDIIPIYKNDFSKQTYDIVGPVCESSDFLGKNRELAIQPGDLLAICTAGAYGFSMSSSYNSRPRPAEVLVDKDKMILIRKRETIQELYMHEEGIPKWI